MGLLFQTSFAEKMAKIQRIAPKETIHIIFNTDTILELGELK